VGLCNGISRTTSVPIITSIPIADLLILFAEQNAYIYVNTHTELREMIKRRLFLETYRREDALQLISKLYMPAVVREFNIKDKETLHSHNIREKYRDPIRNRLNCRRLFIHQSAMKLDAEVRQNIAARLLDWILSDCKYLI
jgi:hypothetical protein